MNGYLLKIKTTIDLLASIGEEIKDDAHIDAIFEDLGHDYNSFVTSIETKKDIYNVVEVEALLLSQERRIAKQNKDLDSETQQMVNLASIDNAQIKARSNSSSPAFFNSNKGQVRGVRNARGHVCGWNSNNRPQCQLCRRTCHLAPQCWHRFDQSFGGPSQAFSQTPGAQIGAGRGNAPQAYFGQVQPSTTPGDAITTAYQAQMYQNYLAHATPKMVYDPTWYPDSGATAHITPDMSNLGNHTNYIGSDKVIVGNGTALPISFTGHSCLQSLKSNKVLRLDNIPHVPMIRKNLLSVSRFTNDNSVLFDFI